MFDLVATAVPACQVRKGAGVGDYRGDEIATAAGCVDGRRWMASLELSAWFGVFGHAIFRPASESDLLARSARSSSPQRSRGDSRVSERLH